MEHVKISKRTAWIIFISLVALYGVICSLLTFLIPAPLATILGFLMALLVYYPMRRWKYVKNMNSDNPPAQPKSPTERS